VLHLIIYKTPPALVSGAKGTRRFFCHSRSKPREKEAYFAAAALSRSRRQHPRRAQKPAAEKAGCAATNLFHSALRQISDFLFSYIYTFPAAAPCRKRAPNRKSAAESRCACV